MYILLEEPLLRWSFGLFEWFGCKAAKKSNPAPCRVVVGGGGGLDAAPEILTRMLVGRPKWMKIRVAPDH